MIPKVNAINEQDVQHILEYFVFLYKTQLRFVLNDGLSNMIEINFFIQNNAHDFELIKKKLFGKKMYTYKDLNNNDYVIVKISNHLKLQTAII